MLILASHRYEEKISIKANNPEKIGNDKNQYFQAKATKRTR